MKKQTSLRRNLLGNVVLMILIQLILVGFVLQLSTQPNLWLWAILLLSNTAIIGVIIHTLSPIKNLLQALDIGVSSFHDKDFSITIDNQQYSEFSVIINTYNQLAGIMRDERMAIYQRELLLDTVIQSTPVALILTNNQDHIVYSNLAAKTLLNQKKT